MFLFVLWWEVSACCTLMCIILMYVCSWMCMLIAISTAVCSKVVSSTGIVVYCVTEEDCNFVRQWCVWCVCLVGDTGVQNQMCWGISSLVSFTFHPHLLAFTSLLDSFRSFLFFQSCHPFLHPLPFLPFFSIPPLPSSLPALLFLARWIQRSSWRTAFERS